jgi:hypothetical protein
MNLESNRNLMERVQTVIMKRRKKNQLTIMREV